MPQREKLFLTRNNNDTTDSGFESEKLDSPDCGSNHQSESYASQVHASIDPLQKFKKRTDGPGPSSDSEDCLSSFKDSGVFVDAPTSPTDGNSLPDFRTSCGNSDNIQTFRSLDLKQHKSSNRGNDFSNDKITVTGTSAKCEQHPAKTRKSKSRQAYGRAAVPRMSSSKARLESFSKHGKWKKARIVSPNDLSAAGFFYEGKNDKVKCFVCGGCLFNWQTGNLPLVEHRRWFPDCKYAELKSTNPSLVQEYKDHPAARAVRDFEYSEDLIHRAFSVIRGRGCAVTAESLLDMIYHLEEQAQLSEDSDSEDIYGAPGCTIKYDEEDSGAEEEVPEYENREINIAQAYKAVYDVQKLREENEKLKQICKKCKSRKADVVFLPCGHLVSCADCTSSIRSCPACSTLLRGIVKIYML